MAIGTSKKGRVYNVSTVQVQAIVQAEAVLLLVLVQLLDEEHWIGEEGREDDCCTGRDGRATTHRIGREVERRGGIRALPLGPCLVPKYSAKSTL